MYTHVCMFYLLFQFTNVFFDELDMTIIAEMQYYVKAIYVPTLGMYYTVDCFQIILKEQGSPSTLMR